jgi:hypothetical protein
MRIPAVILILLVSADPAYAYMGPGAGLAFIGSLIALVAAIAVGLFGLVWYPVKRLIRMTRGASRKDQDLS